MVIAEAHRQVAQPAGGEAPLFAEGARQLSLIDVAGLLPHGLSVRITVRLSRGEPAPVLQAGTPWLRVWCS